MSAQRSQISKYAIGLAALTIVAGGIGFYVFNNILQSPLVNVLPFLLLFMFLVTLGVHILLVRAVNKRPALFVNRFMGASSAKLFIYLIIMVAYALLNKAVAVPFVLTFFILYIVYTFYDITMSNRFFRNNNHS